jgi:hypothetical protein
VRARLRLWTHSLIEVCKAAPILSGLKLFQVPRFQTTQITHPSGFYRQSGSIETDLYFSTNNYEILAYCVQSYSYALGATASVTGFTPQDLTSSDVWPPDPFQSNNYSTHPWHSAEFLFTTADQWNFWATLMQKFGLPTNP